MLTKLRFSILTILILLLTYTPFPPLDGYSETTAGKIELISPLNFEGEEAGRYHQIGDFTVVDNPKLLESVRKIDEIGQLTIKKNGYTYVNIDDRIIDLASQHLSLNSPTKSVIEKNKNLGAHITVMLDNEVKNKKIEKIEELGQWFTYEIKDLYYIDRVNPKNKQRERLWVLGVEAPGLERLRMKYGMKPLLHGHNFHITLYYEYLDQAGQDADQDKDAA